MRRLYLVLSVTVSLLLAGCGTPINPRLRHTQAAYPSPASAEELLRAHPPAAGQAVKSIEVYRTRETSHHLIQIVTREEPHRHDYHDLVGYVVKGKGVLHHGGVPHRVGEGSVFYIPRGAVHHFVNESLEPTAAWVTFSPPFAGDDVVPADAPVPK
jgi:quercetin dioxygenase-like cupin family protein